MKNSEHEFAGKVEIKTNENKCVCCMKLFLSKTKPLQECVFQLLLTNLKRK